MSAGLGFDTVICQRILGDTRKGTMGKIERKHISCCASTRATIIRLSYETQPTHLKGIHIPLPQRSNSDTKICRQTPQSGIAYEHIFKLVTRVTVNLQ